MRVNQINISLYERPEHAVLQNKQSALAGKPGDGIENHPTSVSDVVRDSNQCKGLEGSSEFISCCFDNKLAFSKFIASFSDIISKLSGRDCVIIAGDQELTQQYQEIAKQNSNDMLNFVDKHLSFQNKLIKLLDAPTSVSRFHKLLQLQDALPKFLPLKNQEFLLDFPQYNQSNITRNWSYINLVNSESVILPYEQLELELNRFSAEEYFLKNLLKRIEERDQPFESFIKPDAPNYDQIKKTVAEGYKILQERSIDWNTDQLEFDAFQQIFDKQTETQNKILERLKTICDVEENAADSSFKIRDCKIESPQDVGSSQYQLYALGLGILLSIGLYLKYRPFRRSNQETLKQSIKLHWQAAFAKKNEACDRLQASSIAARNAVQARFASAFQS